MPWTHPLPSDSWSRWLREPSWGIMGYPQLSTSSAAQGGGGSFHPSWTYRKELRDSIDLSSNWFEIDFISASTDLKFTWFQIQLNWNSIDFSSNWFQIPVMPDSTEVKLKWCQIQLTSDWTRFNEFQIQLSPHSLGLFDFRFNCCRV